MIIVSQCKDTIINFKNIEILGIGNPLEDDDGKFKILANTIIENQYVIAKYKTEERAKEVLQEIVKATIETRKSQELNNLFGGAGIIPSNTYYEMPED